MPHREPVRESTSGSPLRIRGSAGDVASDEADDTPRSLAEPDLVLARRHFGEVPAGGRIDLQRMQGDPRNLHRTGLGYEVAMSASAGWSSSTGCCPTSIRTSRWVSSSGAWSERDSTGTIRAGRHAVRAPVAPPRMPTVLRRRSDQRRRLATPRRRRDAGTPGSRGSFLGEGAGAVGGHHRFGAEVAAR